MLVIRGYDRDFLTVRDNANRYSTLAVTSIISSTNANNKPRIKLILELNQTNISVLHLAN